MKERGASRVMKIFRRGSSVLVITWLPSIFLTALLFPEELNQKNATSSIAAETDQYENKTSVWKIGKFHKAQKRAFAELMAATGVQKKEETEDEWLVRQAVFLGEVGESADSLIRKSRRKLVWLRRLRQKVRLLAKRFSEGRENGATAISELLFAYSRLISAYDLLGLAKKAVEGRRGREKVLFLRDILLSIAAHILSVATEIFERVRVRQGGEREMVRGLGWLLRHERNVLREIGKKRFRGQACDGWRSEVFKKLAEEDWNRQSRKWGSRKVHKALRFAGASSGKGSLLSGVNILVLLSGSTHDVENEDKIKRLKRMINRPLADSISSVLQWASELKGTRKHGCFGEAEQEQASAFSEGDEIFVQSANKKLHSEAARGKKWKLDMRIIGELLGRRVARVHRYASGRKNGRGMEKKKINFRKAQRMAAILYLAELLSEFLHSGNIGQLIVFKSAAKRMRGGPAGILEEAVAGKLPGDARATQRLASELLFSE